MTLLWTSLGKGVLLDVIFGPDYLKYAARGSLNMLEYLAPYDVLKGPTEELLLEYAIRKRNLRVLGFLLKDFPDQDLSRALETAATKVTDNTTTIQIFNILFDHGLSIHYMKTHCLDCRIYSCLCKKEKQLKVVQYLLDQEDDPLPKNSP